jgi:ankyrin repeat protein
LDASQQKGNPERIEVAALEVVSKPVESKTLDSRQEPVPALGNGVLPEVQALLNKEARARVTADSTANREALEQALLTTQERLEKTEAELARSREELEQARIRIGDQLAQITTYVGQIDALNRETDALKQRMVSFEKDQAPRHIRDVLDPEPLAQSPGRERPTANQEAAKMPDPATQVGALLKRAAELLKARHLTTPSGNNALELYRQVLKIDPNNRLAISGIELITKQYLIWAAQAKQESDWLNADNYYRKALTVDPSNSIAEAGLREVNERAARGSEKRASQTMDGAVTEPRNIALQQLKLRQIPVTDKSLLISAERGNLEAARLLLAAGISPDAKLSGGWTALMSAATHGQVEVVRALLGQGAELNMKNYDGKTALMAAAWNGHNEVLSVLLDAGAEVDEKNNEGWTALMYAAWNGHRKAVETLLEADASVAVKDANDWSAVTAASSEGHGDIVKLLEMAGGS